MISPDKILAVLILMVVAAQVCWSMVDQKNYGAPLKQVVAYCVAVVAFTAACVYAIVLM